MSRILNTFLANEKAIRRFLGRYLLHHQDIDDVAQNVFLNAFDAEKKTDIHFPKAFLFKVAKCAALRELTKKANLMAPKRYSAMIMGCGLLALSAGSWLASRIGAWVVEQSYFTGFIFLALFSLGAAIIPWILNTRLKRWMHISHSDESASLKE